MNATRAVADKHVPKLLLVRRRLSESHSDPRSCSDFAGCGAVDLISKGLSYSKAVTADLEHATGVKPEVGFDWHNGNLKSVTVMFPKLYTGMPLDDLAGALREVVAREFKRTPDMIVLGFSLEK
jgi:hypothetical protein